MIRKFLVCGKNVYMASSKPSSVSEDTTVIELTMPIETFWEIRDLLKHSDYLTASGEDRAEVVEVFREVFKRAAPWSVVEKDRTWLYARTTSGT